MAVLDAATRDVMSVPRLVAVAAGIVSPSHSNLEHNGKAV